MKSASAEELAMMPPTFAAARNTYSGFQPQKVIHGLLVDEVELSMCAGYDVFISLSFQFLTMAEPTIPRWPATYIFEFLSIVVVGNYLSVLESLEPSTSNPYRNRALRLLSDHEKEMPAAAGPEHFPCQCLVSPHVDVFCHPGCIIAGNIATWALKESVNAKAKSSRSRFMIASQHREAASVRAFTFAA